MEKKKIAALALSAVLALSLPASGCGKGAAAADLDLAADETALEKNDAGNPIGGRGEDGSLIYGGDPSALVDGDTVYLYTGHDKSSDAEVESAIYNIDEWICYSTKDLKNWTYEGPIMNAGSDISWSSDGTSAWAGQVVKHDGKYYFYYCTWDKTSLGKQSIGVAVSDSPTGPFVDKGEPIVKGTVTEPQSSNWNDIDPTVWVEKDASGTERRYLAWGNTEYYICELNEDMTSVKDLNGDGEITCGSSSASADIIHQKIASYTEAPWLYRRQDENGNYYGKYYLFYAYGWREQSAYAVTDNLLSGKWDFGSVIMPPNATSNTSHMAVIDFKGKTYFVYHNGSLPGGNGYRRIANIAELTFDGDGNVNPVPETASGLFGNTSMIYTNSGKTLSHDTWTNSSSDGDYPISLELGSGLGKNEEDARWIFMDGKADASKSAYISFQSDNKPGLYISAESETQAKLRQDTDGKADTAKKQTFRSVKGLDDPNGVSFESVAYPGRYLAIEGGKLALSDGADKGAATFYTDVDPNDASLRSIAAEPAKKQFYVGGRISQEDIKVTAGYANGTSREVSGFSCDASGADMTTAGQKTVFVSYSEGGVTKTAAVKISVIEKLKKVKGFKVKAAGKKKYTLKFAWKKTSGAQGYEIYYSRKKAKGYKYLRDCESAGCRYVDGDGIFKKGKTYYFRIRAYRESGGETESGPFAVAKVKLK